MADPSNLSPTLRQLVFQTDDAGDAVRKLIPKQKRMTLGEIMEAAARDEEEAGGFGPSSASAAVDEAASPLVGEIVDGPSVAGNQVDNIFGPGDPGRVLITTGRRGPGVPVGGSAGGPRGMIPYTKRNAAAERLLALGAAGAAAGAVGYGAYQLGQLGGPAFPKPQRPSFDFSANDSRPVQSAPQRPAPSVQLDAQYLNDDMANLKETYNALIGAGVAPSRAAKLSVGAEQMSAKEAAAIRAYRQGAK